MKDTQHHLQYSVDTEARVGHKSADSVTIKSTEYKEQNAFHETEKFKELARNRYKIVAKNSELKNPHAYDTAQSADLFGMGIQAATTIFAVNLKRIIKLMNDKE